MVTPNDENKTPKDGYSDSSTPFYTPVPTPARGEKAPSKVKPQKPEGSPLYAHAAGYWAKRIGGKIHYFGKWDDYKGAMRAYKKFLRGTPPPEEELEQEVILASEDPTVCSLDYLVNAYLVRRKEDAAAGELSWGTWENYKSTIIEIRKFFGADTDINAIDSEQFARFKLYLVGKYSVSTVSRNIILTRTIFKWAHKPGGLMSKEPDFGDSFGVPTMAQKRKAKSETDQFFSAEQLRKQLAAADESLRVWIYLGLNGGMGSMDISELQVEDVDLQRGVIDVMRAKTSIRRVITLWPETLAGLKEVIGKRTTGRIFSPDTERPLVYKLMMPSGKMSKQDKINRKYAKLLKRVGQYKEGKGFYVLRHVFQTVAVNDSAENVLAWVMGHIRRGQGETAYTVVPPYVMIQKATKYVRDWLLGRVQLAEESMDFTQHEQWGEDAEDDDLEQ